MTTMVSDQAISSMNHTKEEGSSKSAIRAKREKCGGSGNRNNPISVGAFVVEIVEEGGSSAREATRDSPIIVNCIGNFGLQGSPNEPICVDDEVEVVGDRNHPISVDDYKLPRLDFECVEIGPFDPKGKRLKRERRSNTPIVIKEVGESSRACSNEPDAYCNICMEPKFKYECLGMKNCSHLYCSACVAQYVEAKVEENVTSIGCPDPDCKDGWLEPEMCQSILKSEVFNRWGVALCEAVIGSMKFYCPYKDCSALLMDETAVTNGEVIMTAECPHCFRLFCAQCKVAWHTGVSCEEFAKLGEDERSREDIMLRKMAETSQWQRCPRCKFYVEKVSGCMFIKCRCGHQFCYGCATEMTMDHYCKKCMRILNPRGEDLTLSLVFEGSC